MMLNETEVKMNSVLFASTQSLIIDQNLLSLIKGFNQASPNNYIILYIDCKKRKIFNLFIVSGIKETNDFIQISSKRLVDNSKYI